MSESKTVRLDKELMDSLAEQREGFETPNDCLKRLLNQRGCITENGDKTENGDNTVEDETQESET